VIYGSIRRNEVTVAEEFAPPELEGKALSQDADQFERASIGATADASTSDKKPGPADLIIAEFDALETLNDVLANEAKSAVKAQIAKLSKQDQKRVSDAIEARKNELRAGA